MLPAHFDFSSQTFAMTITDETAARNSLSGDVQLSGNPLETAGFLFLSDGRRLLGLETSLETAGSRRA